MHGIIILNTRGRGRAPGVKPVASLRMTPSANVRVSLCFVSKHRFLLGIWLSPQSDEISFFRLLVMHISIPKGHQAGLVIHCVTIQASLGELLQIAILIVAPMLCLLHLGRICKQNGHPHVVYRMQTVVQHYTSPAICIHVRLRLAALRVRENSVERKQRTMLPA